jgi:hypothetical protein
MHPTHPAEITEAMIDAVYFFYCFVLCKSAVISPLEIALWSM